MNYRHLIALALLAMPVFTLGADKDPNPQKDPDVQRGYDDHQKEHRRKDTEETYTVHKSGDGRGGVPTGGSYDPPNVDKDKGKDKGKDGGGG
jgi:hypothetical protein